MRLPGADYRSGTPSFGRGDVNAPIAAAASYASAVNSRGQVMAAMSKVAGVLEAWEEAEDKAAVTKAYSEYRRTLTEQEALLAHSPTIAANAIPANVSFKRTEEKVVDGVKTQVERQFIPTWEVAPGLFDSLSKEAEAAAMAAPRSRASRAWLENNIRDANIQLSTKISVQHMEGLKAQLVGTFEGSIQSLVNSGDAKGALDSLNEMLAAGAITPAAAVKREQKIRNDSANMAANKLILEETDPVKLEAISERVLNTKGVLTDEQASALAKTAATKAERIRTQREKDEVKAAKKSSSVVLTQFVADVRLNKKIPSPAQMHLLVAKMTPEDARQALTLYDRKDGGEGSSDEGVKRTLTNRLIGSMAPGIGVSMDERVRAARAEVDRQFSLGTINAKDWRLMHADAKNMLDFVTTDDPNYKLATESVYANIAKNPKGSIFGGDGSSSRYAVAQEMEVGLFRAKMENPQMDPMKWAKDNMPEYQTKADKALTDKLRQAQLTAFIGVNANGGFDEYKTQDNLRAAYKTKKITDMQFEKGMNVLLDKTAVAPARGAR